MKKMKYIIFGGLITFLGMSNIYAADMCAVCGPETLPIPIGVPNFVSKLITLVQIAVPIIIIIMAIINYTKAVASGEDKVIKETNSSFIRSLITGVAIFLIVVIVKFAFSLVGTEYNSYLNCVSCFLNGEDECSVQTCPNRDDAIKDNKISDKQAKDDNDNNDNNDNNNSSTHTSESGREHGGGSKEF